MTGTLNPFTGLQQGARAGEDAAEGPFETEGTQASEEIGLAQTGATLWAAILALLALSLGLGAVRASRRAQSEAGRST
ncbi:hypothetical protein [Nesterenkonia sp. NBAIMH1]|uniref:hypothetical protein n=1 Tax=Nesterenkonia sp. NBAIMH1 TaxID=2600320 RepID=UPI0011B6B1F4|nr:hypothetical protein [Nesterenkonia sp. NBAIMH1]